MLLGKLRKEVFAYATQMAHDGLAHGSQGNISVIDRSSGLIAITPSAADYGSMTPRDIVVVDGDGTIVKGHWKPTVELPLHLAFYRRRADVGAVVHCHAPNASGFAAAGQPIPMVLVEAACCVGHEVPVAPFMLSGTAEFAQALLDTIGVGSAAVMGKHGIVACGPTLKRAYGTTIAVEDAARAYFLARQLGVEPAPLSADLCRDLHDWWLSSYRQTPANQT